MIQGVSEVLQGVSGRYRVFQEGDLKDASEAFQCVSGRFRRLQRRLRGQHILSGELHGGVRHLNAFQNISGGFRRASGVS